MKIAFNIFCWAISGYFFYAFHAAAGFPPKGVLQDGVFIYILLFSFFLLLPFARSFKITHFFEYTSRIDEVKQDLKDFKSETRQLFSLQSSMISNVSQSVTNTIHIAIPSLTSARAAEEDLTRAEHYFGSGAPSQEIDNNVSAFIERYEGDSSVALMMLRRDLEKELRRILGKEISFNETKEGRKYFSLSSLWRKLTEQIPLLKEGLESSFRYFVDVANAATHGQTIPAPNAEEAISIGLRLRNLLRGFSPIEPGLR